MHKAELLKNKLKMKNERKRVSNHKLKILLNKEIPKSKIKWKSFNKNSTQKWDHSFKISVESSFKIIPCLWTNREWNIKFAKKL